MDPLWPHPTGWANPQIARVSAVLVATWDAAPLELVSAYARYLNLHFTYTRGAVGGAFDWQLEVSPYSVAALVPAGASEWVTEAIYAGGAVALGADTQSRVQREYQTYGSQGAAAEDFVYGPIELAGNVERYRVLARESADGDVQTPGTLQITGQLSLVR